MYSVRIAATSVLIFTLSNMPGSGGYQALGQAMLGQSIVGQPAPQAPMEVTTDTPEYCEHLVNRVRDLVEIAAPPPPREVANLSVEGQRMCEHGQIRGGIMRLRRALMLMMHDDDGAGR
jgi:hypothetical protein